MSKNPKRLSLQEQFILYLKKKSFTGKKSQFMEEIKNLLGIEKSSAYRRMSGEKPMTFEEAVILAKHFNISIDRFIDKDENAVLFNFPVRIKPIKTFKDFLEPIDNSLRYLAPHKNATLNFISREIPVFHYFYFPELTAFKAYIWGRTMWEFPAYQNKKFKLDQVKGIHRFRRSILKHYNLISGVEIWGNNPLEVTLNQIQYYFENGMFAEPEEALLLCDQLMQLMEHLHNMTFHRKKFMPGQEPNVSNSDFGLYHRYLSASNNFLLAQSKTFRMTYVTIDNLHAIETTDKEFYEFMEDWERKLIKQSEHVTLDSDTSTARFFNVAEKKVEAFREQIKEQLNK